MPTTIPALTTASFAELVRSAEQPLLVDFSAPHCRPCDAVRPVLHQLEQEAAGALRVVEVDVDEHPEVGRRYDVMGTPTLVLFRDGEPVRRVVGARGIAYLREAFAEVLTSV